MAFQGDSIFWVEVEKIVPNPFQPRREFDESKLKELADSVRMYGVLQPLTVTRKEVQRGDGTFYSEYELIAGERRLRASKIAGLVQVPVIIRDGEETEQEKLELAIIENLQREDLNAVDRALAFRQLAEVFGLSHLQVANKVGRSREYVSNTIRLLGLPQNILDSLQVGDLAEGHARVLLMLTEKPQEQDVVYREILLKKLSVREVERIVRKMASDKVRKLDPSIDPEMIELEKKFTESLGTRVQIQKTPYGGRLTIDYFSPNDLEEMLVRLKKEQGSGAVQSVTAFKESEERSNQAEEIGSLASFITLSQDKESTDEITGVEAEVIEVTEEEPEFAKENQNPFLARVTEEISLTFEEPESVVETNEGVANVAEESDNITEEVEASVESAEEKEGLIYKPAENSEEENLYSIRNFTV